MNFSDVYEEMMHEHMDLSDRETLHSLSYLEESDQARVLTSLTSRLYDKIISKADDIDFGSIPKSSGDITKIDGYNNMVESLDIIRNIVKSYNEDTKVIDVITNAINNIESRTSTFHQAFIVNVELPIVLYNTITYAIVASTSYMITNCIEYIKEGNDTFEVTLNKVAYHHTDKNLLFENLKTFNDACAKGQIDKVLTEVIHKNVKQLTGVGSVLLSGAVLIGLSKCIIPTLQNLIYFLYHGRQGIADYFAVQADFLQMNAANVIYRDTVGKDKKKIQAKQMKMADRFRKVSNFFDIEYKRAKNASDNTAKKEREVKYKASDLHGNDIDSLF